MKRKLLFLGCLVFILACFLALGINADVADCQHTGEWDISFDETKVLTDVHSVEICSQCNLVLSEETLSPAINSKGYSYYNGSIVQGYYVNKSAISKYEARTGKDISYGMVAAIRDLSSTTPLSASAENIISIDMEKYGSEHFEIKVVDIAEGIANVKLILCAYMIIDGEVVYVDNGCADNAVAGITYDEVVALLDSGVTPEGLYTHRKLTVDEMDILSNSYWHSNGTPYNTRITNNASTSPRYAATRMFTRAEIPDGSYIVVENGWAVRPELWTVDANGKVQKNSSRPYGTALSAGTYSVDDMWDKNSNFVYIGFNIGLSDSLPCGDMTPDGIAYAFSIYVPYNTTVATTEIAKENDVSVKNLKLLTGTQMGLVANKYWQCTSDATLHSSTGTRDAYYATKMFTKEELPVGSVIELADGWMYRPENWVNGKKISTRPNCTSVYRIVVTEDFWDTESGRAFNISRIDKADLTSEDWETVVNSFKIYVPEASTLY